MLCYDFFVVAFDSFVSALARASREFAGDRFIGVVEVWGDPPDCGGAAGIYWGEERPWATCIDF